MGSYNFSEIDSGFTIPGFSYSGPGNPTNNGDPVNGVDELAREHDMIYEDIQNSFKSHKNKYKAFEDIQNADRIFVGKLRCMKTQSWCEALGKLLGFTIINIKICVEKCLGFNIYPRFRTNIESI